MPKAAPRRSVGSAGVPSAPGGIVSVCTARARTTEIRSHCAVRIPLTTPRAPVTNSDHPQSAHQLLETVPSKPDIPDRRQVLSPLRYPGGKRRLVPYIAALLRKNDIQPGLFVEPFAGGASVALELAALGIVKRIALADLDPWVASFWRTVFYDCDWLCRRVETIDVSLATWDRFKRTEAQSQRWQALACLFLNRTSFNGALHRSAGPIGGRAQIQRV